MKYSLGLLLVGIAVFFVGNEVNAQYNTPGFSLHNNSQCVGGTLLLQYGDVQDTGAGIAAKALATQDCQYYMTGPDQCCQVQYRRATPAPPAIGSHVFMYEVYQGGVIGPSTPPAGTLTSSFQHWAGVSGPVCTGGVYELESTDLSDMACPVNNPNNSGAYSGVPTCPANPEGKACTGPCKWNTNAQSGAACVVQTDIYRCAGPSGQTVTQASCPSVPTVVTASLVANPNAIVRGGSSLLTWSSTGAVSCSGNFPTGGATSGSVAVSPTATTEYTVVCTGAGTGSGNNWTEYGYLPGKCVTESCPSGVEGLLSDERGIADAAVSCTTSGATCQMCDGGAGTASGVTTLFSCQPGGSGNSATAKATVSVVAPQNPEFTVSCRAHPSQVAIGEDVLWSSTVTGGEGSYTYRWSGTDGLSGSGNQVFKQYGSQGSKTASLQVIFKPSSGSTKASCPVVTPPECSNGTLISRGTDANGCSLGFDCQAGANPPSSPTPPIGTLPPGTACPAIGWMMPITPCSGTWSPTYDTGGCQSGWQCISSTGGSGGILPAPESTGEGIVDTILNFFQFDTNFDTSVPEIQDVNRDPGAFWFSPKIAEAACVDIINNNQWYSGDAVPIASEGTLTPISCASEALNAGYSYWNREVENRCPGAGVPCEYDPARTTCYGLNSPGSLIAKPERNPPGGYPVHFDSGNVCNGGGTQCPAGQTEAPVFNVAGASCSGGTVVGRTSEVLDGAQIGMWPEGWLANQCSELGATEGDCCEYSQRASNNIGGGFPPNSYYQIRVVRGGSFSENDSTYIQTAQCSGFNLDYSCSSVAGNVGVQCSGNPGGGGGGGGAGTITKTVQCDNAVQVGAAQCSDGIDNDGDGQVDEGDAGCNGGEDDGGVGGGGGGGYDPNDNSEGGNSTNSGAQCSDGIDNNGDGNVDYPDDPGCSSADDNLEVSDPADLSLSVNPPLIKKNQQCTITFSARSVTSCSLTGSGISNTYSATNGFVSTKEIVTPGLQQTATYTLSCRGLDGKIATKKVDCKIAPTFEEI